MTDAGDLSGLRRAYGRAGLDESQVRDGWLALFRVWFDEARAERGIVEANAMQVATVDAQGHPAVRTVLAKQIDEAGVVFYTGTDSAKARDLAANPWAAAVFAWVPLERQVRLAGPVSRVASEQTAAYFATRPRGSQLGAWASHQSAPIGSRDELTRAVDLVGQRFAGRDVPVPPDWGGYRLEPHVVEFWAGRADRLHDRLEGRLDDHGWTWQRLAP